MEKKRDRQSVPSWDFGGREQLELASTVGEEPRCHLRQIRKKWGRGVQPWGAKIGLGGK